MTEKQIQVKPQDIKLGDFLVAYGYVMKVETITIWCHTAKQYQEHKPAEQENVSVVDHSPFFDPDNLRPGQDLACFGIRGSYVSGDRKMFDYFRPRMNVKGEWTLEALSYQQGNERANWHILEKMEMAA